MKKIEFFVSILMLTFAISFNLWLYRAEPTAVVDPNDNSFQYGLVDRTNQMWDYADKTCPNIITSVTCHLAFLTDHWVPNWAEGYNLPYYYSHVPQIVIVGTYRLFSPILSTNVSLFQYYHWTIYLLLCLFPLSVFLALRILKPCLPAGRFPWLTAGIGALLASHISTDGLYGMDPPSFLWRGWGLSSQLFAMIFMPLALAYAIRWMNNYDFEGTIAQFFQTRVGGPPSSARSDAKYSAHPFKKEVGVSVVRRLIRIFSVVAERGRRTGENARSDYILSILFITLTTMGHIGLGLMLFLSLPVIAFTQPILTFLNHGSIKLIWNESKDALLKIIILALPPLLLLSYWLIPTVLQGAYHNTSFWDPIWKFNSYGAKEVIVNLWNGFLFDWGRLPIFTSLVFVGLFGCLRAVSEKINKSSNEQQQSLIKPLPFLFVFFLLLYFGNTTWKGLLNIIPSMNEFHQHRFIVGLHLIGLFLAPIGVMWMVEKIIQLLRITSYDMPAGRQELRVKNLVKNIHASYLLPFTSLVSLIFILLLILPSIYKQTISYGTYNEVLIKQANSNFVKQKSDADLLVATLKNLMKDKAGRVFAGRGGSWGKDFRVAETAYFMYLSANGIPTVLWLPETWSNNSDTEQYFSEDIPDHYGLYNIRYVAAPPGQKPESFWRLIKESNSWKLYEVETSSGYIASGVSPSIVYSGKLSFGNVIRLWIQSPYPGIRIFPELRLVNSGSIKLLNNEVLPRFAMTDEATYITPDNKSHSLFAEPPVYVSPFNDNSNPKAGEPISKQPISIINQSSDTDMVFKATVEVKDVCPTCVVILKQTYHPSWVATVNGKKVQTINVFPSFVGVRLEQPGTYEVIFSYTPSPVKMLLLVGGILVLLAGIYAIWRCRRQAKLRHI